MNTLITILIVVLIVQTCVYIYSHFFDVNINKQNAATLNMFEAATKKYITNEEALNAVINEQKKNFTKLNERYQMLVDMHNTAMHHLPNFLQKAAMGHIVNGELEQHPEAIEVLKEYLNWVKQIKYDDTETPLEG